MPRAPYFHDTMVRILRLGTSDDSNPNVPERERAISVCEREFAQAIGQPVETVLRRFDPTPAVPDVVDKFMERYEPDCVLIVLSSYWCCYETAAYRAQKAWPRPLQPLARRMERWGGRTASNSSVLLRAGRAASRRTVGVATRFEPAEVVESVQACIRRILRREEVALVVRGPSTRFPVPERSRQRIEDRRLAVELPMKEFCRRLHIEYVPRDPARAWSDDDVLLADGIHVNGAAQTAQGVREGQAMIRAWSRIHAQSLRS
jgi:hypothetical protein